MAGILKIKYQIMKKHQIAIVTFISIVILSAFSFKSKVTTIYLIGDSTVADYSLEKEYESKRFPQVGWGQVFQPFFHKDSLKTAKKYFRKCQRSEN